VNLKTLTRPSVGTAAPASARGLPSVPQLLTVGMVVVTVLAFTAVRAGASDHRCGVISAAKWTEHGRSGKRWVVSAYHVGCGFAEAWARRLTHAKIIDQGVFKTHPILDPRGRFPGALRLRDPSHVQRAPIQRGCLCPSARDEQRPELRLGHPTLTNAAPSPYVSTANRRHAVGTPLRWCSPRSVKV